MGKRLPYFPFYALDWVTDPKVQGLSNEQRGIFHWLLCRQWLDGDIPEEPIEVYPLLPPGSDSNAVAYVIEMFFPIVGGGKRRNRRLSDIRDLLDKKHAAKSAAANKARQAKTAKYRSTKELHASVVKPVFRGRIKTQTQTQTREEEVPSGIPMLVWNSLRPFLDNPKTRLARIGQVRGLLQGMTDRPIPPTAVARGLDDLAAKSGEWSPIAVRAFAKKAVEVLEGEAGARAAQSFVLRQPDANQTPSSGWSEDEAES